jgi:hypothetical protein
VVSDASGSDTEKNRLRKKKRSAVIGSGSDDSNAGAAKERGDGKEQTGMVSHTLLSCGGKIYVKKTLCRPRYRQLR